MHRIGLVCDIIYFADDVRRENVNADNLGLRVYKSKTRYIENKLIRRNTGQWTTGGSDCE